jgi:hypothetical protein
MENETGRTEVRSRKILLSALLSTALVLGLIVPTLAAGASEVVPQPPDKCPASYSAADSTSFVSAVALDTPSGNIAPMVAAGEYHTVGLKADGTVIAVGDNDDGQCDVGNWTDIIQIAAGYGHTVGLKSDGSVVAVGDNYRGRCDVDDWTDIIQIAAGGSDTVGLKSAGTVVAAGWNGSGQCDVGNWTDIVQVGAGGDHTVGLKVDGTVVAVGSNGSGRCDVGGWTDIVQVAAGDEHTVGLKSDGTAVAAGDNYHTELHNGDFPVVWDGKCEVGNWTDIGQVTAGETYTVGLKSDGTVITVGYDGYGYGQCDVNDWTDIIQVAAGGYHTLGLKSDGTVVAVGDNNNGQCNVNNWNLLTGVPPINWPLFGGITAGLVASGLVIFFVSRRRSFKMGFGSKIWGCLHRPAATFQAVKEETMGNTLRYALVCLVIFGALAGIVLALQGIDEPFMYIPIAIVSSIIGGMLFVLVGGAWTNLWVYLLAGRKSHGYRQTVKALAYGGTPAYLIGWLLLLGVLAQDSFGSPVLPSILIGLGALALIWALVVTAIGLRELHGVTGRRVAAISASAILIGAFVISVVATILYLVLGIWAVLWWWVRM